MDYRALFFQDAEAQNLIVSQRVAVFLADIVGITLYGVNLAVFYLFHNAYMVWFPIQAIGLPIEKDEIPGAGFVAVVLPQVTGLEPFLAGADACKLGYNPSFDIPAFIGAPGHKAGAPFHTTAETVPTPVRLAAHVADL